MTMDTLHFDVFPTMLGWWGAAVSSRGLYAVALPGPTPAGAERQLMAEVKEAARRDGRTIDLARDAAAVAEVRREVEAFSADPAASLTSRLDLTGVSEFARSVAEALRTVPPGQTVTYGELAAQAGRPGGAKAVGQVMRRNRLPLFVPCHRVVASGGGLGGFSGGLMQKLRLLVHEGVLAPGAVRLGGEPLADPVERVRRVLALVGLGGVPIIETDASTKTVPEAAEALGVEVGQIAKSLLFMADGRPVLVVAAGDRRVDQVKLKQAVGADRVALADPALVAAVTGFPVGGVSPVGHLRPAQVLLDVSLARFPVVYAAAGSPASAMPLSFAQLQRATGGAAADLG